MLQCYTIMLPLNFAVTKINTHGHYTNLMQTFRLDTENVFMHCRQCVASLSSVH